MRLKAIPGKIHRKTRNKFLHLPSVIWLVVCYHENESLKRDTETLTNSYLYIIQGVSAKAEHLCFPFCTTSTLVIVFLTLDNPNVCCYQVRINVKINLNLRETLSNSWSNSLRFMNFFNVQVLRYICKISSGSYYFIHTRTKKFTNNVKKKIVKTHITIHYYSWQTSRFLGTLYNTK